MTDWSWETERFDWEAVDGKLLLPPDLLAGLDWQGMWMFGGNGMTRFWARHVLPDATKTELIGVVLDTSQRQQVSDKGGRKRQIVLSKRSFRRLVRLIGAGVACWSYSHAEPADAP